MCKFEANSELFNENLRGFWPISAFPQQNHPKSDRLLANIIDFGLFEPGEIDLPGFLHTKRGADFQGAVSPEAFIAAMDRANSLLYVADNCGEIIFDCHFINRFLADKRVHLSVRGEPVLNDATREDIEGVFLHGNVTVLDTGDDSPGIVLETCGEAFRKAYEQADLVILKGQGNFEGIGTPGRDNVYSLFVAKCPVIARHIGCKQNDLVLTIPG
uniref:Damage-control phosphatase ARMT1-like metal-binding domain-containing protein n=1 Tax=Candidatus Kentrum sp. DK TaxID=2126562 RepID=A0A450SXL7_9GAMM|nr:MAG: Protein of unknown function DUF89 [Candidatus Kentron sp. DK]